MSFQLPVYQEPDFSLPPLDSAPVVRTEAVEIDGVAPDEYHATSVYPEYFQLGRGEWTLAAESRMDCVVVVRPDGGMDVREFRNLRKGERVVCGRRENGEDGIFVHTEAFAFPDHVKEKFAFRSELTRETSFSIDYDEMYNLLDYEQEEGFILWVLGPAVVFDLDARNAFCALIEAGYVHGLLAGNALATHDLEGALHGTALGQEIYSKRTRALGHYHHLDALNRIRRAGGIDRALEMGWIPDGVMRSVIGKGVPYVLAGSIRDDGPLPEVVADVYQAQDAMRALTRRATTVVALATQLHTIAAGNMTPSYTVDRRQRVRPVFFYTVDMSEFAVNKLANRGSLTARSILTNVQDFVVTVERGLRKRRAEAEPG
jgi:lysine-ketoglutarate reductase/saccharopine dehydrogenase-like protein (TIGR00300 family)